MGTTTEDSNKHAHSTRETSRGHVTKEVVTPLTPSHRFNGKYYRREMERGTFSQLQTRPGLSTFPLGSSYFLDNWDIKKRIYLIRLHSHLFPVF